MSVNTLHEACNLDTSRMRVNQSVASAGLAGGNMGLDTGSSNGLGCGTHDACCSQELRMRSSGHNNASGSLAFQHGSPR
mgnify:FL=1